MHNTTHTAYYPAPATVPNAKQPGTLGHAYLLAHTCPNAINSIAAYMGYKLVYNPHLALPWQVKPIGYFGNDGYHCRHLNQVWAHLLWINRRNAVAALRTYTTRHWGQVAH